MKEKISVTLSRDLLVQLDRLTGAKCSRSDLIEQVLRDCLRERAFAAVYARDLGRINAAAGRLNAEALDAIE